LIIVKGLQPGTYTLSSGGERVAQGSEADWARGVPLTAGTPHQQAAKLLALIEDKTSGTSTAIAR
jgi:hypothetical protein